MLNMISKLEGIPFLLMVLTLSTISSSATSLTITEPIPANHRPYKPDFSVQSGNSVAGRVFVPAVPAQPATSNVAASSLVFESHHEVTPAPATRFAAVPAVVPTPTVTSLEKLTAVVQANPVLAALLISSLLSVKSAPKPVAYNTPEHLPPDPYVALMLSHYGRYIPSFRLAGHGLYAYTAANNIHNNKPFGSYKIYEDSS